MSHTDDEDNVLLDSAGRGADDKARFEITRKVIGRKVTGVRFCSSEEYEPGKTGSTVTFSFEDGGAFMLAVPGGDLELFVSMSDPEPPTGRVM